MKKKKLWFACKKYGWGWYPITWEGWVTIAVWVSIFCYTLTTFIKGMEEQDIYSVLSSCMSILVSSIVLVIVCFTKGPRPKWRWGS